MQWTIVVANEGLLGREGGMVAAIALQQRLGSVPLSLRREDVLDRRFVPKETATGNKVARHPRPSYFVSS